MTKAGFQRRAKYIRDNCSDLGSQMGFGMAYGIRDTARKDLKVNWVGSCSLIGFFNGTGKLIGSTI